MTDTAIVHMGLQAMLIAFELAAPTLLTALLVGFAVSLFQSATQIQEFTLSFVPKAIGVGIAPLRDFMLKHTRGEEIALMLRAGHLPNPPTPDKLDLTTLIPAFVLSELRSAMIIGFVIYIPFLIIDMVVSSSLMSLGMMMLPPVSVSLPFKLLLFVLVDGWGLIINSLVHSYGT